MREWVGTDKNENDYRTGEEKGVGRTYKKKVLEVLQDVKTRGGRIRTLDKGQGLDRTANLRILTAHVAVFGIHSSFNKTSLGILSNRLM